MSSRHAKNRTLEFDPDIAGSSEWNRPAPAGDAETMRQLQLASESVMRLATQTHSAVARGDAAAADAAHASLKHHLRVTTSLIDELLSDGSEQPTLH
ncbi:hypothetical protein [Paraburkholderia phosphatilytica]|uniref:hypothetical protein n=1 Tax=Paraburkholderia phosphatilytica TaxID=2282883 RepID=UPI000E5464EB|nr:hypothetical protein [Paraburkholderia phosphatilytica]